MQVLRDRKIAYDELFRLIDYSGDGIISLQELSDVLGKFGDF